MLRPLSQRFVSWIGFGLIVACAAVTAYYVNIFVYPNTRGHIRGVLAPPPTVLGELIRDSDVIVLGHINGIAHTGEFAGYAEDGHMIDIQDAPLLPGNVRHRFTYVDFTLDIKHVYKGSHFLKNMNILLRAPHARQSDAELHDEVIYPAIGDYRLFFLKLEPDKTAFGISPWRQIMMDGTSVSFFTPERLQPEFAKNVSPDRFLDMVGQDDILTHPDALSLYERSNHPCSVYNATASRSSKMVRFIRETQMAV